MRAARCLLLWAAVSVTGWSTASRQWRERGGGGGGIGNGQGDGRALREGEITRPQRLHQRADPEGGELAHGRLDTRARSGDADAPHPVHLAQLSFLVKTFGTSFILDLELNHDLLSSDYVERHFDEDRTPFNNQGGEHCYYHGTLRGVKGSWVALATCHGLWGMFSDGNFSYGIEPLPHVDEQVSKRHSMPLVESMCTTCLTAAVDRRPRGDEPDVSHSDPHESLIPASEPLCTTLTHVPYSALFKAAKKLFIQVF
ncbi:disintegrin and metalloproteinase domain-containing protein 11 [Clarias gariepinus]|uniref:disintegrin and metalloproteinase domain-containing protein 11 n=1 Tax=Clarias gariepinus TaxID=13013 RepID=UPI00234CE3F5|nr:disintegrin and metalloproteinase domain-containing protein 11 [Clarias gariepinus]